MMELSELTSLALLASGDGDSAYFVGRTGAILLLIFGVIKCISIARRPTTNTPCVLALAIVFAGMLGSNLLGWAVNSGHLTPEFARLSGVLIIASLVTAIVLAIVGLAQYSQPGRDWIQGKAQAIWALVLGCILVTFYGYGFAQALGGDGLAGNNPRAVPTGAAPGTNREFPDLNFQFSVPRRPWVEIKAELISEDATFALMRTSPQMYLSIIAENGAELLDMDSAEYAEFSKANIRSAAESSSIGEIAAAPIGDLNFQRFEGSASLQGFKGRIFYDCRILSHNGFYYQLVFWGPATDTVRIRREAEATSRRFSLIDPKRVAINPDIELVEDIRSEPLGIATHLAEKGWNPWDTLEEDRQGPLFGATFGDESCLFLIDAVPLGELDPSDDVLLEAMLRRHGIDWPDDSVSAKRVKFPEDNPAWAVRTKIEYDGFNYDYQIRIFRHHNVAYMLVALGTENLATVKGVLGEAIDAVEFFEPGGEDNPTQPQRVGRAEILNNFGLAVADRGLPEKSQKFYRAAFEADPSDPNFLGNACNAYFRAEEFEAGLDYLKSKIDKHKDDPRIRFNFGLLTGSAGDIDGAIPHFEKAFSDGYDDTDDLLACLNLFVDVERPADSIPLTDIFLSKNPSPLVERWRATMFARDEQYDTAVETLKELVTKYPDDVQFLYELGEVCNEAGDYTEAESVAEKLVEDGYDNARTTLIKGWSEYHRRWYQRARESFQAGVSKDPSDPDLKEALRSATSALGKADNTAVSEVLTPLELPPAVAELLAASEKKHTAEKTGDPQDGFGGHYKSIVRGVEFKKGSVEKSTSWAKVKIGDRNAISRFSTLQFSFDPPSERLYINEIKVVDEEGKTIASGSLEDYFVTDDSDVEADHDQVVNAPVPGLREGVELHYTVTRESHASLDNPDFRRTILSRTLAQDFHCEFVTGDTGLVHYKSSPDITVTTGDNLIALSIEDLPAYASEPLQPSYTKFLPYVATGSGENSWEKLGADYLVRIQDRLEIDEDIRKLAGSLLEGKTDTSAKIGALSKYVRSELEYKAIEFGVRGQVPNKTARILRDRYGDCKDHSLLLYQLLNSSNIPAKLALVDTRWNAHPEVPSLDQFNHMIVYLPGEAEGTFIDCTDKFVPSARLLPPLSLGGRTALVLDSDAGSSLVAVADYPEKIERIECRRTISVADDQNAAVSETVTFHGYTAAHMREYLAGIDPGKREERLHSLISADLEFLIEDLKILGLDDADSPFVIKMDYLVKGVFEIGDGSISGTLPCPWERYYLIPTHVRKRHNPFEIEQDFTVVSEVVLTLEDPVDPDQIAALKASSTGKICQWEIGAKPGEENGSIHIESEVSTAAGKFEKKDYATYESEVRAAVKAVEVRINFGG